MTQKEMETRIEKLLEMPYRIIDILPGQVPADSPGQYFAVEKYLMTHQSSAIRQKHIHTILKINCYYDISIDGILNPPPEQIRETMTNHRTCILLEDSMILSDPDETYMTLYHPDEPLLALVEKIAASEGLFVWKG